VKKYRLLCCEIFYREVCALAAESPAKCDVEFLPKGLHDLGVEKMMPRLQERIDAVKKGDADALLLGYGLCNNGIAGLTAREIPIVVPRAHDCITLFMGSRQRYREYFNAHPGTYYRTTGWLERSDSAIEGEQTVSQRLGMAFQYEELAAKYGEENAKYIIETIGDPVAHYDRITFIRMGLACEDAFRDKAKKEAEEKGWQFEEIQGSMEMLRKLIFGEWDDDFLIVPPGKRIVARYADSIIESE